MRGNKGEAVNINTPFNLQNIAVGALKSASWTSLDGFEQCLRIGVSCGSDLRQNTGHICSSVQCSDVNPSCFQAKRKAHDKEHANSQKSWKAIHSKSHTGCKKSWQSWQLPWKLVLGCSISCKRGDCWEAVRKDGKKPQLTTKLSNEDECVYQWSVMNLWCSLEEQRSHE